MLKLYYSLSHLALHSNNSLVIKSLAVVFTHEKSYRLYGELLTLKTGRQVIFSNSLQKK